MFSVHRLCFHTFFLILFIVDGEWSVWASWQECEKRCVDGRMEGTRKRFRYCDNPRPLFGGRGCHGTDVDEEGCGYAVCEGKC